MQYLTRRYDPVCVLTATHYVVSCSAGPGPRNLQPFSVVFDGACVLNLIRKGALFDGWEGYVVRN